MENNPVENKSNWKKKIIHEFHLYLLYTLFLTIVFIAFSTYRRLLLGEAPFNSIHIGYNILESLILAKIILLGQGFGLGEKFRNRPLIYPTMYKAIVFIFFVFIFSIMEHFIVGFFTSGVMENLYKSFKEKELYSILDKLIILFFVFVLFFAIVEANRALGEGKLFNLFFKGEDSR